MTPPVVLGLTGSVGMGKSTTARMFAEAGCDVWDADAVVHKLYGRGGAAVAPLRALRSTVVADGAVSRARLKEWLAQSPEALAQIEAIVHPLVAADRTEFLKRARSDIVVLDVPLLFETGANELCDYVVVVSAPPEVQRDRVLDRPGMTEQQFEMILANQMDDAEKRRRADFVIPTTSLVEARAKVQDVLGHLRRSHA